MPRFPLTPAIVDAELEAFVDMVLWHPKFVAHAHGKASLMASLAQIKTGLDDLKTAVSALVEHANAAGNVPGVSEADLDSVLVEITDLKATVDAVVEANAAPTAPQPLDPVV